MFIGPEHVVGSFLATQLKIVCTAAGKPVPHYLSMMVTLPDGIFAPPEPSSLLDFAKRDLRAIERGQTFCPEAHELGTEALKAYEAATELAKASILGIEARILYGRASNPARTENPQAALDALQAMEFSFKMGRSIYDRVTNPDHHHPLRDLLDHTYDKVSCARKDVLRDEVTRLAEESGAFEGLLENRV